MTKPSPNTDNIGLRLKQIRLNRKMTIRFLAQKAGVDAALISRLENGRRPGVYTFTLRRLAGALDCTCDELVIGPARSLGDAS